jgi:hypothetical protein
MRIKSTLALALGLLLIAGSVAAQTTTAHSSGFLTDPTGNLFLRLNEDGSQLIANRSPQRDYEELVSVPSAGGTEIVWHRSSGRSIYNRFAFSNGTLVFAKGAHGIVYRITKAGGTPLAIANVSPDTDPRQLTLSTDGKWVAFTASNFMHNGKPGRVRANLYVAATDGSKLHKITASALTGKLVAFDLSGDGKYICWVDDSTKGPWIAGVDGKNARRLPLGITGATLQSVHCDPTAATIYYQTNSTAGVKLHSISRAGTGLAQVHATANGHYHVARDTARLRLRRIENPGAGAGKLWTLSGASLTEVCAFTLPRYAGSWAWSGDGKTLVWRGGLTKGSVKTFVWRASS